MLQNVTKLFLMYLKYLLTMVNLTFLLSQNIIVTNIGHPLSLPCLYLIDVSTYPISAVDRRYQST